MTHGAAASGLVPLWVEVLAPARTDVWGDVMRRQPWPLPLYSTYPVDVRDN